MRRQLRGSTRAAVTMHKGWGDAHVGRRPPSAHPSCAAARLSGRVPQEKKGGAEETRGHCRLSRAAGDGEGVVRHTRILLHLALRGMTPVRLQTLQHRARSIAPGDYVDLRALRSRFVTQMTTSERALHSRNGWGFAAGGDGDSLPDNFLAVPR